MLIIKILSLGAPERYALRRMVTAILQELPFDHPHQEITICEVSAADQIGRYAAFLVLPTLVINEKVVCSGRYPGREEVIHWLQEAMVKI